MESKPENSEDKERAFKCPVCGKAAHLLCSRCKAVRYCSKECQKQDWKEHKKVCSVPGAEKPKENLSAEEQAEIEKRKKEEEEMKKFLEFVRPKSLIEQAVGKTLIDVQYMHPNEKHGTRCGYCGGKKENPGSASWGVGVPRLSVVDYQAMMDRCWRRCGTYAYKYDPE